MCNPGDETRGGRERVALAAPTLWHAGVARASKAGRWASSQAAAVQAVENASRARPRFAQGSIRCTSEYAARNAARSALACMSSSVPSLWLSMP